MSLLALLEALQTDQLNCSLPAHRRGIRGGMDAATEPQGRTCGVSCDGGRARPCSKREGPTPCRLSSRRSPVTICLTLLRTSGSRRVGHDLQHRQSRL
ncbi:hypothetical protein FPL03_13395 [Xanthomonas citri pv. glycines]|nr:hypothetical protein FPK90_14215 [Xanthomonas citri pv. glycines]QDS07688.1 hypothetical protein FPL00_13140 [Xanthomonas citri pv. glycines]QDS12026.1 hypothetical protein FPL03_13395 [Xanthomonas citri pv. glycines]QDS20635.1 hypothetical protein FPL05_13540 [Xanthomonas citri pv. glycines]TSJ95117.1 hypothetical protein FPK99_12020 [Xanthomonas citri pv. glycines]